MDGLKNPIQEILDKFRAEGKVVTEEDDPQAEAAFNQKLKETRPEINCVYFRPWLSR